MKKTTKKLISTFLALVMILTIIPIGNLTAFAKSFSMAQLTEGTVVKAGDVINRGTLDYGYITFVHPDTPEEQYYFGMDDNNDADSHLNNMNSWTVKNSFPPNKYGSKPGWYDSTTEFVVDYAYSEPDGAWMYYDIYIVPILCDIILNKSTTTIAEGSTETLTVTFDYIDESLSITDKTLTWSSNKTSVATVSSSGVVTAVAPGTATITVKSKECNYSKTCTVTVTHAFDTTKWTSDATSHWHAATCTHTTEKDSLANHSGGTATCTAQATCSTCGAKYGQLANHSFNTTASTTKATDATCTASATYKVKCDNCTAVSDTKTVPVGQPLGHSFATVWSTDETKHWYAATCGHESEKSGEANHTYGTTGDARFTCTVCSTENATLKAAAELADAKEAAKEAIDKLLGTSQNEEAIAVANKAKEDIDLAKTIEDVDNIKIVALRTINAIFTPAEEEKQEEPAPVTEEVYVTKAIVPSKSKIKVTVNKVDGVDGYQIQYGRVKSFKKSKKTITTKKTVKTIKVKKPGKKYYVRVRSFKIVDGKKVYSKWSKIKSIKTK